MNTTTHCCKCEGHICTHELAGAILCGPHRAEMVTNQLFGESKADLQKRIALLEAQVKELTNLLGSKKK